MNSPAHQARGVLRSSIIGLELVRARGTAPGVPRRKVPWEIPEGPGKVPADSLQTRFGDGSRPRHGLEGPRARSRSALRGQQESPRGFETAHERSKTSKIVSSPSKRAPKRLKSAPRGPPRKPRRAKNYAFSIGFERCWHHRVFVLPPPKTAQEAPMIAPIQPKRLQGRPQDRTRAYQDGPRGPPSGL